jgi:hypothetical protein
MWMEYWLRYGVFVYVYDKWKMNVSKHNPSQWPFHKEHSILTEMESKPSLLFWQTDGEPPESYGKDAKIFRVHTPFRLLNIYRPLEGSHGLHMQVDAV